MNDDVVLRVNGLGKQFKLYPNPWGRLGEWVCMGKGTFHKPFWAVRDVSFEVRRGECLGIIGINGAGKSTLLKMMTGVLQATEGTFQIDGRVLSLLDLSGGFDKYLTGRENVIRTTEFLGFPDGYALERMDQVKEFSELGEFFDYQERFYSTGMSARLAFSLYAFLEADVFILDEVLAAGDIFFRQKCYARLEELLAKGTTIILVSHMIPMIQHYSSNVLVLHRGEQVYHGETDRGISVFRTLRTNQSSKLAKDTFQLDESDLKLSLPHSSQDHSRTYWPPEEAFTYTPFPKLKGDGQAQLTRLAICNEQGTFCQAFKQGERAYLYYEYQLQEDIGVPITTIDIFNEFNVLIHSKNSLQSDVETPQRVPRGEYLRLSHSFTLALAPGNYIFNLRLSRRTS